MNVDSRGLQRHYTMGVTSSWRIRKLLCCKI